jgi:hypothetical protein
MELPNTSSRQLTVVLIVLAVLGIGAAFYFYNEARMLREDPQRGAREQAEGLSREVGRLVVLPTDEVPTVATVTNPEALKSQAFFAQAKVGDKVLIYAGARRAVLYDPIARKVLEVTSIVGDNPSVGQGATIDEEPVAETTEEN